MVSRGRIVAERRLRYPILWLAFVVVMLTGAGLLLSADETRRAIGLALLLLPLAGFALVAAVYYLVERYRALD